MNFADKYFKRFNAFPQQIATAPARDLQIVVVIPCCNEPNLIASLKSLDNCSFFRFSAEVIVVINSSEFAPEILKKRNLETYNEATSWASVNKQKNLKFHFLLHENLPEKFAGVGLARKIGMDEAVRRFAFLKNEKGIITGFDADSLTESNYFEGIFKHFTENPNVNAASLYFEHPLEGNEFNKSIYIGITNYELHLRYFNQALRWAKFPFAYHTVGSSFAVRAKIYAQQGGMNRRKAGEDFYFLQKIIPLGNYAQINDVKIIPSPRTSSRVPFGTGAALAKMEKEDDFKFLTYNFKAFEHLKIMFLQVEKYYQHDITSTLPEPLKNYLVDINITEKLPEMRKNSTDIGTFKKRFFAFFDAFKVIRFLNIAHENYYAKVPAVEGATSFFEEYFKDKKQEQLFADKNGEYKSEKALYEIRCIENKNLNV